MNIVTYPHWAALLNISPEQRADYTRRCLDGAAWRLAPEFARAVVARDAQLSACGIERKTFRLPRGLGIVFELPRIDTQIVDLHDRFEHLLRMRRVP